MSAGPAHPLVSVIVPAWNAEQTLAETLHSAAAQTHRDLEILIIDDGSTDDTAALAAEFCASDPRARLIRQKNGGLASARNCAIDAAQGDFIAPLDADDLWHPEKIERQLATFAASSAQVALVYCWYRMIDERGCVIAPAWAPVFEGRVFARHLECNFGTGSAPLIRRSALGDLRYELSRPGEGGCEDWLLQLQIAARHEIACTRAFLLGYRQHPRAMSADSGRMIRAHIQMYRIIEREFPGCETRIVRRELARWRAARALTMLRVQPRAHAIAELAGALAQAPLIAGKTIVSSLLPRPKRSGDTRAPHFQSLPPGAR
ncbi:MAG: glycosyltransferase family 2 protein [Sphingomicrobium sp.]